MDILLLYLFVTIERLAMLVLTLGWPLLLASAIALVISLCLQAENTPARQREHDADWIVEQRARNSARAEAVCTYSRKYLPIGLTLVVVGVLLPSKQDLAIIVGGHLAYKGVTSETFQASASETSSKLYRLIQQELDDALEDAPTQPTEELEDES